MKTIWAVWHQAVWLLLIGGMGFFPSSLSADGNDTADKSYAVFDSFGKHRFQQPPQRIVVTDWALLEQLLELGVQPLGAPELDAYRDLVARPSLPAGMVDIGLRRSPDMQKIRALEPDLIILGTDQKKFARPFSRIARVMYYQNFSPRFASNGEKAKQRLRELAKLVQQEARAESKLAALEQVLDERAAALEKHFATAKPPVTLVRLAPDHTVFVYGGHSMPGYVLQRLGFSGEVPVEKTKLGVRRMPVSQLKGLKGYMLYWRGSGEWSTVLADPDWKNLPPVLHGRAIPLDTAWSYGGAMSLGYIATAISDALLKKLP